MEIKIIPLDIPIKSQSGIVISAEEMQKALDVREEDSGLTVRGRFGMSVALENIEESYSSITSHIVTKLRVKSFKSFGVQLTRKFPWVKIGYTTRKALVGDLVPMPSAIGHTLYDYICTRHTVYPSLKGIGTLDSDNHLKDIVINYIDLVVDGNGTKGYGINRWKK